MDNKTILIVEDDKDLAKGLSIRLEANGYDTIWASDANLGIDKAINELPDLILLDLGLPDDNGFVMIKKMEARESLSSIPVIVVTGRSPEIYKEAALIAGAKGYLQKPIDNDELLAVIRKALPSERKSNPRRFSKEL
jgi:DNA-binding response OmpR family regulator